MTISQGERLPAAELVAMTDKGPAGVALADKLSGRKVVLFGLPGAFTGTCTTAHVPSFIRTYDHFTEKGVAEIICLSVNDPFVMGAWGETTGATAAGITMLGDPSGAFVKAIGLDFDAPPVGLYGRSKRFAMVLDDGVVTTLHLEESPGVCEVSGGEALLATL